MLADHSVVCSMSRSGGFLSSFKTERTSRKTYRSSEEAKADVFGYIERFYNAKRRHSTFGYMSPMEFERRRISLSGCHPTRGRPALACTRCSTID